MMVTPLRDGMNLVAHEFVLCQTVSGPPGGGAGRCSCPSSPGRRRSCPGPCSSTHGTSTASSSGSAPRSSSTHRNAADGSRRWRERVEALDSRKWADGFLTRLGRLSLRDRAHTVPPTVEGRCWSGCCAGSRARGHARSCSTTTGRSASSSSIPILPCPRGRSARCFGISRRSPRPTFTSSAAAVGRTSSGGSGSCPIHLCAEHGYLARAPGGEWHTLVELDLSWMRTDRAALRRVASDVPGAHVERKACSVAWHYREAELEYGSWRAHELLNDLGQHLAGAPAEILQGHRVIEVRARGVDKGVYVRRRVPRREGRIALRDRARRRPDRPRPPGRAPARLGGRARGRAPPEHPGVRRRAAGARPRRGPRGRCGRCSASSRPSSARDRRRPPRPPPACGGRNAAACPRAFASRSSSSSSAPMRRRSSSSSRRCVRIISGPSVAIVNGTPCSTKRGSCPGRRPRRERLRQEVRGGADLEHGAERRGARA